MDVRQAHDVLLTFNYTESDVHDTIQVHRQMNGIKSSEIAGKPLVTGKTKADLVMCFLPMSSLSFRNVRLVLRTRPSREYPATVPLFPILHAGHLPDGPVGTYFGASSSHTTTSWTCLHVRVFKE